MDDLGAARDLLLAWGNQLGLPANHHLIAAFGSDQQKRNLSPRTISVRRNVLRLFATFCGTGLLSVTPLDVDGFLDSRRLAAVSRGYYISHLHTFYAWAIREEITEADPTAKITIPKTAKRLPRPISEEDLAMALEMADHRTAAMVALGAYAGLRCMEIAGLRTEDLNTEAKTMLVHGKGQKDRVVPIATKVEDTLSAYRLPSSGPVFTKRNARPYTPATISARLNEYLHGLGISATAHQLRHRFGTLVYQRSKDILLTQRLMGHESVATTMGYVAVSGIGAEVVRSL